MGKTKKEKKVKAKKDKDAPKRAISAFFFYNKAAGLFRSHKRKDAITTLRKGA